MSNKSPRELAEIVKGVANEHRVAILKYLQHHPKADLAQVAGVTKAGYKTTAFHLSRMSKSGLLTKAYSDSNVLHTLTKRGERFLNFLRNLE